MSIRTAGRRGLAAAVTVLGVVLGLESLCTALGGAGQVRVGWALLAVFCFVTAEVAGIVYASSGSIPRELASATLGRHSVTVCTKSFETLN